MLSEKVKEYLKEKGLYDETEDADYQKVMDNLGINWIRLLLSLIFIQMI